MAVVPPILVLNYTLPSNPQQVKQEVEARSAIRAIENDVVKNEK